MEAYFDSLDKEVKHAYGVAEAARRRGLDPETRVEIPLASDLASRVEKLLSAWHVEGVADRIRELSARDISRDMVALTIARELAMDPARGDREKRLDVALRTGLAILTEGILVAPLEGLVEARIREDPAGPYVDLYYAGPIRAAGGTAQAISVLMADVVRRQLNLAPFVATEEEVGRYKEEVPLYKHLQHLQYSPTAEEIEVAVRNIPVCINGEATEVDEEVTAFRNLKRVDTAGVRGGACLVLAEGICQKARKLSSVVEKLGIDGWDFLKQLGRKSTSSEEGPVPKYLAESVGGRPILAYPHRKGGFRLIYGRSRTSGLAAASLNPATMTLLDDFVALGTQLKTEYPGKAAAITSCDTIEGPIVLLNNGDLVAVNDAARAKALLPSIQKIVDLGEILVSYGEFLENNYPLVPGAYTLAWHLEELRRKGVPIDRRAITPSWGEALEDSRVHMVPLHPRFNLFWHDISTAQAGYLSDMVLVKGMVEGGTLVLPDEREIKDLLIMLGLLHSVRGGAIYVDPLLSPAFVHCLGLDEQDGRLARRAVIEGNAPDATAEVSRVTGIRIKPRGPSRIGARVGRPEKARLRMMKPPVHTLFPVEMAGGPQRALNSLLSNEGGGRANVSVGVRKCPKCGRQTPWNLCSCGEHTEPVGKKVEVEIPVGELFTNACARLRITDPPLVKGVRGLISRTRTPEPVEKGILRAQHDIYVYQDGTSRIDLTDIPLTHFRPAEINLSVERAKELGYETDVTGAPLSDSTQLLELRPQDIVVSSDTGEYLLRLSRFLDQELVRLYGLEPYYEAETPTDLIGHQVMALAPHTSGAVLGRIIGYTEVEGCFAHPAFHASKRRNCDGDEDSVTLLLDGLLNFSFAYLPETRGGLMDKPLVLTTRLDLSEVDKEAQNVDILSTYPLEFYEAAERRQRPKDVEPLMETAGRHLKEPARQFSGYGFTHDTTDIALGPTRSAYRESEGMASVVAQSMSVVSKISAVNLGEAVAMVLNHHFLPDIMGNMKSYATQHFRCRKCGVSYRRPPLRGLCASVTEGGVCDGELSPTVYEGAVTKYLGLSKGLATQDGVGDYLKQRVQILEASILTLFPQPQTSLQTFSDEDPEEKL